MAGFVAYYRVSTARQGQSGLGLDAQRSAVAGYVAGRDELMAEFTEVESSRKNDRPQLAAALALCRQRGAVLVIAKLDRLARDVAFVAHLTESGAEFVAVGNPYATKLLLHMLAAFAEHERDQISARTTVALAAAKARGGSASATLGRRKPPPSVARSSRRLRRVSAPGRGRAPYARKGQASEGSLPPSRWKVC